MSSKIIYERFLWFYNKIKEDKYPNSKTLSEKFGISRKTAQRDIDFMRDRLDAPFVYVHERRGFSCEDNTYELPGLWLEEESLTSLILAYRLAQAVPDEALKTSLRAFLDRILENHAHPASISIKELSDKVSVRNIEYSKTSEKIYHAVLQALLAGMPVQIVYYSPHNSETTTRDILPLHLLHYMGTWHIVAHCALKNELRDFVLSRIKTIKPGINHITARASSRQISEYIRRNFGIIRGEKTQSVCLRFAKDIAPWIAEQSWHKKQKTRIDKNGRLCLTIPVADFREIKREILRFGAQVEVVSPVLLRKEVKNEIEKLRKVYA